MPGDFKVVCIKQVCFALTVFVLTRFHCIVVAHNITGGVRLVARAESNVAVLERDLGGILRVVEDQIGVNEEVRGQSTASGDGRCQMMANRQK